MTTCVGVATIDEPGDLEVLIRLAGPRLYEAKHSGRDRVVRATGTGPSAVSPRRSGSKSS